MYPDIVMSLSLTWAWFDLFESPLLQNAKGKKCLLFAFIYTNQLYTSGFHWRAPDITGNGDQIPHSSFKLGARSYCSIEREYFPGFFKMSMVMGWFKGRTPLKSHDHCCASVCPAFLITAWHYILSLYCQWTFFVCMSGLGAGDINEWLYIMHASFTFRVMCLPLCITNYNHS